MKIGILSDSHGKAKLLAAAMKRFADRHVEAVVHCGDIGSVECLDALAAAGVTVYVVPGNMDRHIERLRQAAEAAGLLFAASAVVVPIGPGVRLAATHGHDGVLLHRLIAGKQFAYVCHGHTHEARDEQIDGVRVINPGALHRPKRPRHPTVAVLDTTAGTVEHLSL